MDGDLKEMRSSPFYYLGEKILVRKKSKCKGPEAGKSVTGGE